MTPRVTRRPARVEWLVTIGDTCELTVSFVDEAGVPIDLSGRTFTASIDGFAGGATVAAIPVDDTAAAGGVLVLSIDDTTTAALARDVVWWLAEQVAGEPRTLLDGPLRVARRGGAGVGHAANALTVQVTTSSVVVVATAVTGPASGGGGGPHAASHGDGGTDEVSLDASQIVSGVLDDARIPAAITRDSEVTAAVAALSSVYQPLDSDLTAIAALATTAYGRALLALANQAGLMALVAVATDTTQGKVELATTAEATTGTDTTRAVTPAGLKASVDAAVAGLIASAPGALDTLDELAAAIGDDANFAATVTTALAGKQPLDSDLTAIAALSTTVFGRSLLALADAVAGRTALGLGGLATLSAITSAEITDGTIVNADISAAAAIAASKIAGLAAIATSGSADDLAAGTVPTARLGSGTADGTKFLRGDSTWAAAGGGGGAVSTDTLWDAKGDLAVGTGADTAARLAVGTDGHALLADAATASGLRWVQLSPYPPIIKSGSNVYRRGFGINGTSGNTAASSAQIAMYYPIFVDRPLTLAALVTNVGTAEAGALARLAMFTIVDGQIGSLVVDYGTVDCSTTGTKEATGSTVLPAGWYAMGHWTSNHASVRFRGNNFILNSTLGDNLVSGANAFVCWSTGGVDYSAGFPTGPTPVLENSSVNRPCILARFT